MALSKIAQCYEKAKEIRDVLHKRAILMETIEDKKYGILTERWICVKRNVTGHPVSKSVVLWVTPSWWDLFIPADDDNRTQSSIDLVISITDE